MRIVFALVIILAAIVAFAGRAPAYAAMEHEEIVARLATGLSLKATAPERRRARKARARSAR